MSNTQKIKKEITVFVSLTIYFSVWIGFLMLLKFLILTDYQIEMTNVSKALVAVLVLAKVVLLLESVKFGIGIYSRAAWVDVALRTTLYLSGVFIVMLLEKAFDGRHEYDGFISSLMSVFHHADIYHVWLNILCFTMALLIYNVLSVVRKNIGKGKLLNMFLTPLPEEPTHKKSDS